MDIGSPSISDLGMLSDLEDGFGSEDGSWLEESTPPNMSSSQTSSWVGFSSDFAQRAQEHRQGSPTEELYF